MLTTRLPDGAGGEVVCRARRSEGSPTLLMLHGAGGNHCSFDELLPSLDGLQVVVPALPGRCGTSGKARVSVGENAEWIAGFAEANSLSRLTLLGHSFGGANALETTLRAGELGIDVRALVLVSTGAKLRVHPTILEWARQAAETGKVVGGGALTFMPGTPSEVIERYDANAALTAPEAAYTDWQAANVFDRMADLGAVSVPTLVLGGKVDPLTPEKYARYLAAGIEGARLELVDDAGHNCFAERPERVAEIVRAFVFDVASSMRME